MFKHKDWPACKAIANVCKFYTEMLDDEHKYDIYIYIVWKKPNYKK